MFVESFRPGTLEKMGLGPEMLLERNPKLVIVRISGFGQDGPYRRRPGFGTLIEGMSGFASINGFADREPVLPPMYLADARRRAFTARPAVMIALREVEQNGGRGQVIDLPLLDPLFAILGPQAANYRLTGKVKPRTGSRSTNSAPRNAYRCKDGQLRRALGLDAEDGRADVPRDRPRRISSRIRATAPTPTAWSTPRSSTRSSAGSSPQRTQAENVAFFEQAEVTIGPIYDVAQILEDPHVIERELVADYPDPRHGCASRCITSCRVSPGRPARSARRRRTSASTTARCSARSAWTTRRYAKLLADGVACEGEPPAKEEEE